MLTVFSMLSIVQPNSSFPLQPYRHEEDDDDDDIDRKRSAMRATLQSGEDVFKIIV